MNPFRRLTNGLSCSLPPRGGGLGWGGTKPDGHLGLAVVEAGPKQPRASIAEWLDRLRPPHRPVTGPPPPQGGRDFFPVLRSPNSTVLPSRGRVGRGGQIRASHLALDARPGK